MDIGQVLENAMGTDAQARSNAEAQLEAAARDHFVPYLSMLNQALGDANYKEEVRMLAAIALKNQLTSKTQRTRVSQQSRWLGVESSVRSVVKNGALEALRSPADRVASAAAQLVAAIADAELPRDEWPELTGILVSSTRPEQPDHVKRANLLAIGYICETADPQNMGVVKQMDGILTAIIQGAQGSEANPAVRETAINALVNSLEFIRLNFGKNNERDYIMQVVCEATQGPTVELQAAAFGALGRIMALYYEYMQPYMEQALFGLTVTGMNSPDDNVTSMAVEFWSTVCEEEILLAIERQEAEDLGVPLPAGGDKYFHFARTALPNVLPTLLNLLTRQNEDVEDDEWNVAMAAGACLQLFAQNTHDDVIPLTVDFVAARLNSSEWASREAAVMAFGSVLEGPNTQKVRELIQQALHPLLNLMSDPSIQVVDTVAWCLGRVADLVIDAINVESDLPLMITALLQGIRVHPKVSTNCCWAIMNLAEQLSSVPHVETSPLSPFYPQMITALVEVSSRSDNEFSARTSAYEALSTLVIYSQNDTQGLVISLSGTVLERLEATIGMQSQIVNSDDRANLEELQINLLGLLTNIIRRAGETVRPAAERLMTLFLTLLRNKLPNSSIDEDVFISVGAVAGAVGQDFTHFAPAFVQYLVDALKQPEFQSSGTAVGLVADIAHAIGAEIVQYVPPLMQELIVILQSNDVRREIKPSVVSCIGDIASSIGDQFAPYLSGVNTILQQGAQLQVTPESSLETVEYLMRLREAILDAYVGIVAGMRDAPQQLQPFVPDMLSFVNIVYNDSDLMKKEQTLRSAVGLLGDIAAMFSNGPFQALYKEAWVTDMIKKGRDKSNEPLTRDTAKWAREQQKKQHLLA